jgi:hypothetical protein
MKTQTRLAALERRTVPAGGDVTAMSDRQLWAIVAPGRAWPIPAAERDALLQGLGVTGLTDAELLVIVGAP